jgi:hypothetical protein
MLRNERKPLHCGRHQLSWHEEPPGEALRDALTVIVHRKRSWKEFRVLIQDRLTVEPVMGKLVRGGEPLLTWRVLDIDEHARPSVTSGRSW